MKILNDIPYSSHDECRLDIYFSEPAPQEKVYIFFHGGGLEGGDKSRRIPDSAAEFAARGISVVSANYRMYPRAKYPDFIEDAADAVNWVNTEGRKYFDFSEMYIGGVSAGAYLAMMLCFDGRYLARHGIEPMSAAGYIFTSGQPTAHFNVLRERGEDTRLVRVDDAAPLYHVASRDGSVQAPRFLIFTSDGDIAGRRSQNMLLRDTMRELGFRGVALCTMYDEGHCTYCGGREYIDTVLSFISGGDEFDEYTKRTAQNIKFSIEK